MPDIASDVAGDNARSRIADLNVSGHLMTLEPGLFCIVQLPSKRADAATGLPGVRVSLLPGTASRPEAVTIGGFGRDGWLDGFGDAILVRVRGAAAQILVTIYQSSVGDDAAPSVQVMRLLDTDAEAPTAGGTEEGTRTPTPQPAVQSKRKAAAPAAPRPQDMVAHIQTRGDVGAMLGEWLGERGSKRWIEGFAVAPTAQVAPADLEYQAVLGRGWLSPWAEGGQFCGSRGMALPVLGLRVRLRGEAERDFECVCSATFVDGSAAGPVAAGQACEAESLAPLEAFQISLRPRGAPLSQPAALEPVVPQPDAPPAAKAPTRAKVAAAPVAKPAATRKR
jgi:hypothetical protein